MIYFWFGFQRSRYPLPESIEKVKKKTKPSDDQDVNKEPLEEQAFVEQHEYHQIPEDQAEEQAAKNQNQNGGSHENPEKRKFQRNQTQSAGVTTCSYFSPS